jgi:hypothetical protein
MNQAAQLLKGGLETRRSDKGPDRQSAGSTRVVPKNGSTLDSVFERRRDIGPDNANQASSMRSLKNGPWQRQINDRYGKALNQITHGKLSRRRCPRIGQLDLLMVVGASTELKPIRPDKWTLNKHPSKGPALDISQSTLGGPNLWPTTLALSLLQSDITNEERQNLTTMKLIL